MSSCTPHHIIEPDSATTTISLIPEAELDYRRVPLTAGFWVMITGAVIGVAAAVLAVLVAALSLGLVIGTVVWAALVVALVLMVVGAITWVVTGGL